MAQKMVNTTMDRIERGLMVLHMCSSDGYFFPLIARLAEGNSDQRATNSSLCGGSYWFNTTKAVFEAVEKGHFMKTYVGRNTEATVSQRASR